MNLIHRLYCRSGLWRSQVAELLPWATMGVPLADSEVLELGSGPGLTTAWLLPRTARLTAVEADEADAARLAHRLPDVTVCHADASRLPFPAAHFDVVVCFTMLHHVPGVVLQDQLFAEARRVLRPGGVFAGSDSRWGPAFALAHVGDTLQLVHPETLPDRLSAIGFTDIRVATRRAAFRFHAAAAD